MADYAWRPPVYGAMQYDGTNGPEFVDWLETEYPNWTGSFQLVGDELVTNLYWTGNFDPVNVGDWLYVSNHPNAYDNIGIMNNAAFMGRMQEL